MASAIKVICRFRPQNRIENENNGQMIITLNDDGTSCAIDHSKGRQVFNFDRVFDWTSAQKPLFEYAARPIVEDVMRGYNGTVFAYGQTGSGKTFTMQGPDIDNPELKGIIPRIVEHIFTQIMNSPSTIEFTVSVSYMEIYLEKIRDLLDPRNDNLMIHEDKFKGVYVKGLRAVYVTSPEETMEVMRSGASNRVVSATNMNEESSRSHSMFLITISQKNTVDQSSKTGKLYLVDLAGSEVVSKTGAAGQTLEEAKKINRSLTSLGMVINALTDGKSTHIPYRDSKLTRILQESLGGNSRTSLVINCSPSSYNELETLSTLRFGMRAKKIENKAKINQELSPTELRRRLEKAHRLIILLRSMVIRMREELNIWRNGGTVNADAWTKIDESVITEGLAEVGEAARDLIEAAAGFSSPGTSLAASAAELLSESSSLSTSPSSSTPLSLDLKPNAYPEEFFQRENELVDQIAEKEAELKAIKITVTSLQEEVVSLRTANKTTSELQAKLNEAYMRLEQLSFDNREMVLNVETIQASKEEAERKLQEALITIEELRKDVGKEDKMKEMLSKMFAELGSNDSVKSQADQELRQIMARLDGMDKNADSHGPSFTELLELRNRTQEALSEAKATVAKLEAIQSDSAKKVSELNSENDSLRRQQEALETKYSQLEAEYETLLDEMIAKESENQQKEELETARTQDLHVKLEAHFNSTRDSQLAAIEELRKTIAKKTEELDKAQTLIVQQKFDHEKLLSNFDALTRRLSESDARIQQLTNNNAILDKDKEIAAMRVSMARQLADFNLLRDSMSRDLENRCLKVVELEMLLDEARDQYQSLLRSQDIRTVKKVEQQSKELIDIQRQLVQQNQQLKKDMGLAQRKLFAREERVHNLEMLLLENQERSKTAQESYEKKIDLLETKLAQALAAAAVKNDPPEVYSGPKAIRGGGVISASSQPKTLRGGDANSSPTAPSTTSDASANAAPSTWTKVFGSNRRTSVNGVVLGDSDGVETVVDPKTGATSKRRVNSTTS